MAKNSLAWPAENLSNANELYQNAISHPYVAHAARLAAHSTTGWLAPDFVKLFFGLTPLILILPSDSIFRKALYPLQLLFAIGALVAPFPADSSQVDLYLLGLGFGNLASRVIDRVYIHNPEDTFLRKGIDDKPGKGPNTYSALKKLGWAVELISSTRGIGWNWQVGGVPKPENFAKWQFVWKRLNKTLITFSLIHIVSLLASTILTEDDLAKNGTSATLVLLLRNPMFLRFFITAGWLTVVYGHVTLVENMFAIVMVATGIAGRSSNPNFYPPMFGNIGEAYSLRRCWGKFWHAALRRSTNAPGEWLIETFPSLRRPKSQAARLLKRYGLLFLAFAVSGLVHAVGSYMATRDSVLGLSDGGALVYFLAQPAAILLEDAIFGAMGVSDDGNPSRFRRIFGYVYVAAFWLWCFPALKVMPLAKAHGLHDGRGEMMGAVRACYDLAEAFPFNPAKIMSDYLVGLSGY